MPQREIVWDQRALAKYSEFLARRTNVATVRECVEQHLHAVAAGTAPLKERDGPAEFINLYRFECRDGETILYVQAEFEILPDGRLGILGCNSIRF